MKKLFSLFLALALLFLTACNIAPSTGTTASGPQDGGTTESQAPNSSGTEKEPWNWQDELQDQIVIATYSSEMIDIPSRIIFESYLDDRDGEHTLYFSKADEKAYIYCFDPLCDHTDMTCLAKPDNQIHGWDLNAAFFYKNRFYCVAHYGSILSFSFDGTDKRIEYDLGYEFPSNLLYTIWSPAGIYGPYLYISLKMDQAGFEKHTLRYNLETKEMEDLTEKTGNYIYPHFFYNGMIYGTGNSFKELDVFFQADLNLNTREPLEQPISMDAHVESILIGGVIKKRENIDEWPEQIGISMYNIETGEQRILTKEQLGLDYYPTFIYATEEYLYFYNSEIVNLGTTTVDRPNGSQITMKVQKMNDGKLYRMNPDGTNIVCVYNNPDYELSRNMIIYDDRVVMQGQYVAIENGEKKVWGGQLQVAVINEDGTFGEFREVEVIG